MRRSLCLNLALGPTLFVLASLKPDTVSAQDVSAQDVSAQDVAAENVRAEGVPTENAPAAAGSAQQPPASPARSPNVVEAERYAAQAFDAYSRKDYERALELYEAALAAAKSADILYNLARVHDVGLHEATLAIEYYRRYLAEPKAQPARSQLAERRIAELQAAELPAAQQATALENTPGTAPATALVADDAPTPAALAAPLPSSGWTWRETTAAALAGSGVVALGVGVGFGIAAYSRGDDWRHDCDGNSCTSQQGVDAARSAARSARVATVALAAGGALLAGGAAVWWFGSKREESSGQVALGLAPTSAGAEVGCSLAGSF